MITKVENIGQHLFSSRKSVGRGEKSESLRLSSTKAEKKAKQLLHSIMHDFPLTDELFTHNFD